MIRRGIRATALVAVAGLALAGCTSASDSPGSDAGDSRKVFDTAVVLVTAVPDSLTPSPWGGNASHVVLTGLNSHLLSYDRSGSDADLCEAPSTELTPRLAKSWEITEDENIILELSDLKSQWGNEITAEDVKWSLEIGMIRQPVMQGTLRSSGFDVDNIATVIDDKHVQLNVTDLTSYTLASLQNSLFFIHDSQEAKKHATDDDPSANDWLQSNLADFSGWKLEEFTPGTSFTVVADPDWGGERGTVERVVVKAVPDTATRSQLMENGEGHVSWGFEYDQYASLQTLDNLQVWDCTSETRDTLMFNTTTGPTAEPEVRRAISMAIDRESLVSGPYSGFGNAAQAIFPMADPTESYEFNPEKAKQMIADAGYPDGFTMELTYSATRPGPVADRSAILIQSMLSDVGITVELNNMASSTDFSTAVVDGRYQAILYSEPIVIADPAFYSYAFYGSNAPSNSTGWSDTRFDDARLALASTDDPDERLGYINQMAGFIDEGAPIISLVEARNIMVAAEGLSGAIPMTNGPIRFAALGK